MDALPLLLHMMVVGVSIHFTLSFLNATMKVQPLFIEKFVLFSANIFRSIVHGSRVGTSMKLEDVTSLVLSKVVHSFFECIFHPQHYSN